jgi:hypothetical protein
LLSMKMIGFRPAGKIPRVEVADWTNLMWLMDGGMVRFLYLCTLYQGLKWI